jgi:hypothetical protein
VGVIVGLWTSVATAKTHPPDVTESRMAAAGSVDSIELPAGTVVTREAPWDPARDQYGPGVLTAFRLARAATVCSTQLPAHISISVRHGLPAFANLDPQPSSGGTHVVWTAQHARRIGVREIRAGDTVGVECPSGRVTVLASSAAFEVGHLTVDSALWYPADLGGGLLSVRLRVPAIVDGIRVPAEFSATFGADGSLVTLLGPPTSGVVVGDRVCWTSQLGTEIRIDHDHAKCVEAITGGARCDARNDVRLYDGPATGRLASCKLAAPFSANGHTWTAGATVRLDRDGRALVD